jgi:hypothetical protein
MSIQSSLNGRELGIKEVLELGLQVYKKTFKILIPAIIFSCIYLIAQILWYHRFGKIMHAFPYEIHSKFARIFITAIYQFLYGLLSTLIWSVLFIIFSLPLIFMVDSALREEEIDFKDALKLSYKVWLPTSWVVVLQNIITGLLMLLFIIPGFIWLIYYTFATYAVALEKNRGKAALDYSKALVQGRWWKICDFIFLVGLITTIPFFFSITLYKFIPKQFYTELIRGCLTGIFASFTLPAHIILFRNLQNFMVIPEKVEAPAEPVPEW